MVQSTNGQNAAVQTHEDLSCQEEAAHCSLHPLLSGFKKRFVSGKKGIEKKKQSITQVKKKREKALRKGSGFLFANVTNARTVVSLTLVVDCKAFVNKLDVMRMGGKMKTKETKI